MQSKSVGTICIARRKHVESCGDAILLSDSWPLFINLKQKFFR